MTLDPISIATSGYLCHLNDAGTQRCPDVIAIATHGYICEVGGVLDGSGTSARARRIHEELQRDIRRDDEEIVVLLTTLAREI